MPVLNRTLQIFLSFLAFPLGILAFNFFLFSPWFLGEAPANLGSIEVSYVSMAKFLVSNWPHLSWAPFWYLGFPFHVFYTPTLPVLTALLNVFGDISLWQAYRIFTGLGLILAPVSLYFLILSLTRNQMASLGSALLYSVMPTIFNFILSSGEVRVDSFSGEMADPRRLVNLARWGEGPHIFSLIFLPLAGLFFHKALLNRRPSSIILAAFFSALTALTNAIGLYGLILLLAWIFIIEIFFEEKRRGGTMTTSILTLLFFYGLIAFWYNLTFMKTFFGEGGGALNNWLSMLPWGLVALAGGGFVILFSLKKVIKDKTFSAIFLWALSLFLIVAIYYFSAPPQLWQERLELAPQALRFVLEVDMAIAAFIGVLIAFLAKKISAKSKYGGYIVSFLLAGGIGVISVGYGLVYASTAWKAIGAEVDLEKTAEKKMADFLASRVDPQKGERVFLAGNYAFYLNYFTDIWQLRGGLYQAKTHPWPEHIYYQLRVGTDPKIAQAWLEIINAKYVAVIPGPEYEEKAKFETFPLAATLADGSLIYKVPLSNTSPVKIVNLSGMKNLTAPKKGDDKESILDYNRWIGEIPNQGALFQKINNDSYQIKAQVGEGEGILVQMTASGGWRARTTNGLEVAVKKDPLGFFVLIPQRSGEYEIILSHGRTLDIWLGYLLTLLTLVLAGGVLLGKIKILPKVEREVPKE